MNSSSQIVSPSSNGNTLTVVIDKNDSSKDKIVATENGKIAYEVPALIFTREEVDTLLSLLRNIGKE